MKVVIIKDSKMDFGMNMVLKKILCVNFMLRDSIGNCYEDE